MERFPLGHVVDGVYRVDSILSESDRAHVYGVTHVRYPEAPLALKVPTPSRALDFEKDTRALASLASNSLARICDVGKLADGRMYRVVERLSGPTLREAVVRGDGHFSEPRALELLVALAETVHEAHGVGIGPCDLTLDNLMFADGIGGRLCMLRVLVTAASAPNNEADHVSLTRLKQALTLDTRGMRPERDPWKPPSSVREIREALSKTGGKNEAPQLTAGARIDEWQIASVISETVNATVYDATSNGRRAAVKIAGPRAKHDVFLRQAYLLGQIDDPHVVKVFDIGTYTDAPYVAFELLHATQANRLEASGPLPIEDAVRAADEMLAGAAAIGNAGGGPADFSLDHTFAHVGRAVLTHPMTPQRRYGVHGSGSGAKFIDAWSAAVALYEMLAGRLPFPTSKRSLAKAWMGVPLPLVGRRRDVPKTLSTLVNDLLTGDVSMTNEELRGTLGPLLGPAKRPNATPRMDGGSRDRAMARASAPPAIAPTQAAPPVMPRAPFNPPPPVMPPAPPAAPPRISAPPPEFKATMFHGSLPPPGGSIPPAGSSPPPALHPTSQIPAALADTDPHGPPAPDWRLEISPSRCPLAMLVAASLGVDGRAIVGIGQDAIARYRGGNWTIDPARGTAPKVRRLIALRDETYLALTTRGPLLRLAAAGGFEEWGPTLERFSFHAALEDDDGITLLGGTTDDRRRGVIAKLTGESLTILSENLETRTLLGAARLGDGTILATSEGGSIVRLRGGTIAESLRACELELHAVQQGPQDILVVGAGAWAFKVTLPPLAAHLDPVDTLSAMTCLTIDENGNAWAGTVKGRIMRRRHGHWRRMNRDIPGDPAVLAIFASENRVRAVLADGRLVLGQPIKTSASADY